MKLIVGLGNPGPEYEKTRHNIGFMAIESQAEACNENWKLWGPAKNSEIAQFSLGPEKVILQKPLTFMNLSGQAVVAAAHFFKVLPEDILVIHDEVDLPFGDVRLKVGGGPGGHNGLKSLISSLASSDFARVRLGIGRPTNTNIDTADYVLGHFGPQDWTTVEDMIQRALKGIAAFVMGSKSFSLEMNALNRRAAKEKKE